MRYIYTGPDGATRHGARKLNEGDVVESDESLDGHPFFVSADGEPEAEEAAEEEDES